MKVLVDDLVQREYFGVILTGGEPTLHPELPKIARYARDQGLHVRMITNGHRLADDKFAKDLAEAGLQLVHVSIYSTRPDVEEKLRGTPGTLERAFRALENANKYGIEVNINSVINKLNADHLHETIEHLTQNHPYIRHFVWNNLDPSMGRAEVNQADFTPKLADFEFSLQKALTILHESGRTFRVEKVPLCYMTEFAWASTETRKIVKLEERIVHFLDDKQTVRQVDWDHIYAESCDNCTLRPSCGGLFDRGNGYDPKELYPVFVSMDKVVEQVLHDPSDPSFQFQTLEQWRTQFEQYNRKSVHERESTPQGEDSPIAVGQVNKKGLRLYQAKRNSESKKAVSSNLNMETSLLSEQEKA